RTRRGQDRADHGGGEAHQERDASRRLTARTARESQKRPEHIGTGRKPRKEKVEEDVPGPLRGLNEVLREEPRHPIPRRLKATRPAITASTAVTAAVR